MWRPILLLIAVARLASAQGELSGPSLGYFFDPNAQALRRIWGIPGSAIAGESLDLGFPVLNATLSPAQDYALVTAGDGSVNLVRLGRPDIAAQPLAALPAAPDRIVISPSGNAAAFVYGATIKIMTGLPGLSDRFTEDQFTELDTSGLPGAAAAIALSDDGNVLLASVPANADTSSTGGVFVLTSGGSGPRLIAPSMASDVSFFPASHDALLADENGNSVTFVADVSGDAAAKLVFMDARLSAPTLARPIFDGQRILIASAANSAIGLLDRNGANAIFMTCACRPDRAASLNNLVYQITDPGKGLLWILDVSQDPRLFFVPIAQAPGISQ